jgi:hypothetical protein
MITVRTFGDPMRSCEWGLSRLPHPAEPRVDDHNRRQLLSAEPKVSGRRQTPPSGAMRRCAERARAFCFERLDCLLVDRESARTAECVTSPGASNRVPHRGVQEHDHGH